MSEDMWVDQLQYQGPVSKVSASHSAWGLGRGQRLILPFPTSCSQVRIYPPVNPETFWLSRKIHLGFKFFFNIIICAEIIL